MKKILWFLTVLYISAIIVGCYADQTAETTLPASGEPEVPVFVADQEKVYFEVAILGNSISFPVVKMLYDHPEFSDETAFIYKTYHTESQLKRDFLESKIDVGIVSFNTAYQLLELNSEYRLAGILTYEFPIIIGKEPLDSMTRLIGKNIHINASHESFLNAFLNAQGIKTSDVNIIIWAEEEAMMMAYNASLNSYCLMSEPYFTRFENVKTGNHYEHSLEGYVADELGLEVGLPLGVVLIRETTGTYYPQVIQHFMTELKMSSEWIKRYPEAAGGFAEQFELVRSVEQFVEDVSHMTIAFDSASEAQTTLDRYMTWLYDHSLGGVDPKKLADWLYDEVIENDTGAN